ncbi:beta-fructofuranosidase, insoluble isoenzyme 4 isoform X1 [Dendrobium catenatum]|uniref:beta-fructofuranosidase, insoluble isoenzyme 4 isoform X1 n=2 Tax=Dendrobium catenatum TaxID=906689 RepID=UPI0009F6901C|nr:beta-fructofuranosidase, insoluble isoenzyme 4 isoform X1 [Dendrobium catenatum]
MAWRWRLISFLLWLPSFWNDWNEPCRRHLLNQDSKEAFSIASKQYRTAFHFQPPQNWINDPNGPMLYNGIYHLFYQYNPYSAKWGNITWGHSISTDLINWTPLDIALRPSEPFDLQGCWSGSATILPGNKPVILYTGISESGHNVQNIALPKNISDPFLLEWVKPPYNPVMVAEGVKPTQFRDPSTCWLGKDGLWRTTVGAEDFEKKAKALLYRSKDFVKWTRAEQPLFSTDSSSMIECIDFFPVSAKWKRGLDGSTIEAEDVKHVLKMGVFDNSHDYYLIGKYLEELDEFIPENVVEDDHRMWLRYDYGSFYASKTFFDAENRRRVLWAWSNESDTISDDIVKGWAGVQTVPRTIWLDENGKQLVQWPVRELESLRMEKVELKDVKVSKGGLIEIKGVKASQADIEVEFEFPELKKAELIYHDWKLDDAQMACDEMCSSVPGSIGPFGLLVLASHDLEEHTAIFFRVFKTSTAHAVLMCSDQRKSSLWPELYKPAFGGFVSTDIKEGKISLRTLIDHSVVESFGAGGRTCITARVYPKLLLTGDTHIYVFNNGSETVKITKLKAWEMAKARIN